MLRAHGAFRAVVFGLAEVHLMRRPEYSIVVPVYNEGPNIEALVRGIEAHVHDHYELLLVYDFDEDDTLPALAALSPAPKNLRLVKNTLGRGVVNAIRAGFQAAHGALGVVVTMADLSDPPEKIPALADGLRAGHDVMAGSRYMPGGSQSAGPKLKQLLSRLAGVMGYYLTGIGIHDVTTNFRAYSRRLLDSTPIESQGGFELGLELTVKCHLRGWRVGQVPSSWQDRSAGKSRFRLLSWLPGYLRWYIRLLLGDPLGLGRAFRRRHHPQPASYDFFHVHDLPGYGWVLGRPKPGLVVVPVTDENRLVLIRTWRPSLIPGLSWWEVPGGQWELGEAEQDALIREVHEETGYSVVSVPQLLLADGEAAPGMSFYPHRIYQVRVANRGQSGPTTNAHEGIVEVGEFSLGEVVSMIQKGDIRALPTIAAVGLYLLHQYESSVSKDSL